MNDTSTILSPRRLGVAVGGTGVVFYVACILTMSTVPRERAVQFFNSLLHGIDVEPVLREQVPVGEVALGIAATFALGWFAGALIAAFYNLLVPRQRK